MSQLPIQICRRSAWRAIAAREKRRTVRLPEGKATIARALGELVDDGCLGMNDALRVGESILRDGPLQTYHLGN